MSPHDRQPAWIVGGGKGDGFETWTDEGRVRRRAGGRQTAEPRARRALPSSAL